MVKDTDTVVLLADMGSGQNRLGGSTLAQVFEQVGSQCPDIDNVTQLGALFKVMQDLIQRGVVLACHDRSDGGTLVAISEMCFAGFCGANVKLNANVQSNGTLGALFSEEIGVLFQIHRSDTEEVLEEFKRHGLQDLVTEVATITEDLTLNVHINDEPLLTKSIVELKQQWWETSYRMQHLRDNPMCADQEFEHIADATDPGIQSQLTFSPVENTVTAAALLTTRPPLAILREQGVNGHVEMAAAFDTAGFECVDVHMSDITSGKITLDKYSGLVACGGFSYGDVLGAGGGWASSIRYNDRARAQFEQFFNRQDVFGLGVCNGCQMFSHLSDLIPGASAWPAFKRNASEQFEARVSTVQIESSSSILFVGMQGSTIPVVVAHGEGRVERTSKNALSNVTLRYVDNNGEVTTRYPLNPNGSVHGITGLCSDDGRFNIMMPHPERVYRRVQNSYQPESWGTEGSDGPWLRMFRNARVWVAQS